MGADRRPRLSPAGWLLALAAAVLLATGRAAAQDLDRVYRSALESSPRDPGHAWSTGPRHVWALSEFRIGLGSLLEVECGSSQVVFGVHPEDGGVLWAAVFPEAVSPEEGARLRSSLAGDGERVKSCWLRFHPDRLGRLFPRARVAGRGDADRVPAALRLVACKLRSSWQVDGRPRVPWRRALVVDVETEAGRRLFHVDTAVGRVRYEAAFEARPVPAPRTVTRGEALSAFDRAWSAFDREYPRFGQAGVDWDALRETWRSRAAAAGTSFEVGVALAGLLEPLDDLHVSVRAGGLEVPLHRRRLSAGGSLAGTRAALERTRGPRHQVLSGRTADGVGYLALLGLSDPGLVTAADEALAELGDCWGLVVDLRFNRGGSERLARDVAGRFLADRAHYGAIRLRDGPGHEDLGPPRPRRCEPRGPWTWRAPLVVLQGGRTTSSAEALLLMLSRVPGAATLGARSGGSSGNPRRLELAGGIEVTVPRWVALDAEGVPYEDVGLAPDVRAVFPSEAFGEEHDPVMAAALARLRRLSAEERGPGRPR